MVLWLLRLIVVPEPSRTILGLAQSDFYSAATVPLTVFLTVGLLGVNARQAGSCGKLGRTGLVVALIGFALMFVGGVVGGFKPGPVFELFWLGLDLFLPLGFVLYGIATLKARMLPPLGRFLPLIIGLTLALVILSGPLGGVLVDTAGTMLAWAKCKT